MPSKPANSTPSNMDKVLAFDDDVRTLLVVAMRDRLGLFPNSQHYDDIASDAVLHMLRFPIPDHVTLSTCIYNAVTWAAYRNRRQLANWQKWYTDSHAMYVAKPATVDVDFSIPGESEEIMRRFWIEAQRILSPVQLDVLRRRSQGESVKSIAEARGGTTRQAVAYSQAIGRKKLLRSPVVRELLSELAK